MVILMVYCMKLSFPFCFCVCFFARPNSSEAGLGKINACMTQFPNNYPYFLLSPAPDRETKHTFALISFLKALYQFMFLI